MSLISGASSQISLMQQTLLGEIRTNLPENLREECEKVIEAVSPQTVFAEIQTKLKGKFIQFLSASDDQAPQPMPLNQIRGVWDASLQMVQDFREAVRAGNNKNIMASLRALIGEKCYDGAIALAGWNPIRSWTYRYLVSILLTEEYLNLAEAERAAGLMKDEWYEPQQSLAYKSVVEALVQHEPFEINIVTAKQITGRIKQIVQKMLTYRIIITALLKREPFDVNNVKKAKEIEELMGKNEYQEGAFFATRARLKGAKQFL